MLFNTSAFALFFALVVALYWLVPHRLRKYGLLLASYYFYASWRLAYLPLIWLSTLVDYWLALQMEKRPERRHRRPFLYLSLAVNLGILAIFKYADFLSSNLRLAFEAFGLAADWSGFDWLLPVGISFYTFQTMSYSIEVYRGRQKAERDPVKFALYVAFFPQLVAGPIERAARLLPQFGQRVSFDADRLLGGLQQMIWGLAKKVVIADRLAIYVDQVYGHSTDAQAAALALATFCFAIQIYADFSGYSDMAIGAARVLGYDLMDNFNLPYLARSPRQFWARWHISLSTWFRDYVYIPLGGNRVGPARWWLNILVVFGLSGLWHGANWTFVLWGLGHGLLLLLSVGWYRRFGKLGAGWWGRGLSWLLTMVAVGLLWVFFRAESVEQAFDILGRILLWPWSGFDGSNVVRFREGPRLLIDMSLLVLFLLVDPWVDRQIKELKADSPMRYARWWLPLVVAIILIFGIFGDVSFIYFQF